MKVARLVWWAAIATACLMGTSARAQFLDEKKATDFINEWAKDMHNAYGEEKGPGREKKMRALTKSLNSRLWGVSCSSGGLAVYPFTLPLKDLKQKISRAIAENELPVVPFDNDLKCSDQIGLTGKFADIRFTIEDGDNSSAGSELMIRNLITAWRMAIQKEITGNQTPADRMTKLTGISQRIEAQVRSFKCRPQDTFDIRKTVIEEIAKNNLPVAASPDGICNSASNPGHWSLRFNAAPKVLGSRSDTKAKDSKAQTANAKDAKAGSAGKPGTIVAKKDDKAKKPAR